MKKNYIMPSTVIVGVELQQMIAVSKLSLGDPVESAEVAEGRETMRNYNVWGDEEEDF